MSTSASARARKKVKTRFAPDEKKQKITVTSRQARAIHTSRAREEGKQPLIAARCVCE